VAHRSGLSCGRRLFPCAEDSADKSPTGPEPVSKVLAGGHGSILQDLFHGGNPDLQLLVRVVEMG
jgi:hypothetical protein